MWEFWFILLVLLMIQHLQKSNALFIPLFISTLTTLFIATYAYTLSIQLICFVILFSFSTLLCSIFHVNPILIKPNPKSLTQLVIGQTGIVTKAIGTSSFESGIVKLDHEKWHAISYDQRPILQGQVIKVLKIQGIHLIVFPYNPTSN